MARKRQVLKKAEKISDEKESEKGEKKVQKTPPIPKKKSPPPKKEKKGEILDDEKSNKRALKSPPSYATLPSSSSMVEDSSKIENEESLMDKKESIVDSQIVHGKRDGSCHPATDKTESSTAETTAGEDDSDEKKNLKKAPQDQKDAPQDLKDAPQAEPVDANEGSSKIRVDEKTSTAQDPVNKDTEKTSVLPKDNKTSKEESELQESDQAMHDKSDSVAETLQNSKEPIEDDKTDLKEVTQESNEDIISQIHQTQESSILHQESVEYQENDSMIDSEVYPSSPIMDADVLLGFGSGKTYDELLKTVYKGSEDEDDQNDLNEEALFGKVFASFKDDLMPDFEGVPPQLQVIGRELLGAEMILQSSIPEIIKYPSTELSRDYPPIHLYDINEAAKSRNMRNPEFKPKTKDPKFRPWYQEQMYARKLYKVPEHGKKLQDILNKDKLQFLPQFKDNDIVFKNGMTVTKHDLVSLRREGWLNDAIIDAALNYLWIEYAIKDKKIVNFKSLDPTLCMI